MPELPEVETVRKVLESWVIDKTIKKVYVYYPNKVDNSKEEELNAKLKDQVIIKMERLGKFLIFRLNDYSLVSHLRMEGKWHYGHFKGSNVDLGIEFDPLDKVNKDSKHVHFVIEFNDGTILMYHDVRKFGRIELFNKDECYINEPLTKLGLEPFNELMNEEYLLNKFSKLKCSIKEALLDQSILVGLGNIYCDEVLYACKLLPSMKASEVTYLDCSNIIRESIRILNKAIEEGGSTIRSYHAANSVDGKFQNSLLVYGKEKENCVNCNSLIYKSRLGGRGTHFCPHCQKSKVINRVIGVTGLIGSGKSTVSNFFKEKGYILLDADKITKDAQLKDGYLYKKMLSIFKKYNILDSNNELNRDYIRSLILENDELNLKLKLLVHNYVYNYIYEEIFNHPNSKYVLDVPLLFESHINEICDKVILVDSSDDLLIKHLKKRNTMSIEDALKFKKLQKEKIDYSKIDIILNNDSTLDNLEKKINELIITFNK